MLVNITKKGLLEKTAIMKMFKYLPFDSELKKQTGIVNKYYQELEKVYIDLIERKMFKQ